MDYGGYYPTVAHHHPLTVSSHHHGSPHLQPQQASPNIPMLHSPMPSQNMRQVMTPSPHHHQMHQMQSQQHQNMGHHQQQQQPQQQMTSQHQHQNYHHIQQPHSHGPPVSHSSSPHPQQQNQMYHNHQQSSMSEPITQQSAISPQQMHSQSPHHHGAPPIHLQHQHQQQQSLHHQIVRPQPGPSIMGHQQSNLPPQPLHHHHQQQQQQQNNSFNGASMLQSNIHHYPQQSPHHLSQHQQSQNPQHQRQQQQQPPPPTPSQMMHHSPPITSQHSNKHQPAPRGSSLHLSNMSQIEMRIVELNKRLQCRPIARQFANPLPTASDDEAIWWERFAREFFEDDATLTLRAQEDEPVEYNINRRMIPKFFKTYFDGGVTDLTINLRNSREVHTNSRTITLDCDQASIVTKNIFRNPANGLNQEFIVNTDGHLIIDFVSNRDGIESSKYSIKSWRFYTKYCCEYIDRSLLANMMMVNSNYLGEPVTRNGLTKSTLSYLKMCMIMKSMQDLMYEHKHTKMEPRACLKKLLFDRYKFKSDDDGKVTTANKRRKRKPPAASTPSQATNNKKSKANAAAVAAAAAAAAAAAVVNNNTLIGNTNNLSPTITNNSIMMSPSVTPPEVTLASLDIMVVGEPSMMGADFSDDNERLITKLENSQCDHQLVPSPPTTTQVSSECHQNDEVQEAVQQGDACNSNGSHQSEAQVSPKEDAGVQTSMVPEQTESKPVAVSAEPSPVLEPIKSELPVPIPESKPVLESPQAQADQTSPVPEENEKENEKQRTNVKEEPKVNPPVATTDVGVDSNIKISSNTSTSTTSNTSTIATTTITTANTNSSTTTTNTTTTTTTTTATKNHRRRSSERKETLREGLMRTSDFVVAMKDLKTEHPSLWRITTGNNLLQQFEPKSQNGAILYENTNQYAGWNPDIKKDFIGVDVRLTQHTRNQITVERLLLNFQKLDDVETFCDKHFVIYLQILISTALDPRFWEGIESDPPCHDYFITSRKIIDDTTKRYKLKLANKLKLSEVAIKNIEKYPNLSIKPIDTNTKAPQCQNCNTDTGTQSITFGDRSYDLHSFKPVKVTSGTIKADDEQQQTNLCDPCFELVKLYSEVHHMGWKFYMLASKKVEKLLVAGKPISCIVDECLKDEDWLAKIYAERDSLWSRVDQNESRQ